MIRQIMFTIIGCFVLAFMIYLLHNSQNDTPTTGMFDDIAANTKHKQPEIVGITVTPYSGSPIDFGPLKIFEHDADGAKIIVHRLWLNIHSTPFNPNVATRIMDEKCSGITDGGALPGFWPPRPSSRNVYGKIVSCECEGPNNCAKCEGNNADIRTRDIADVFEDTNRFCRIAVNEWKLMVRYFWGNDQNDLKIYINDFGDVLGKSYVSWKNRQNFKLSDAGRPNYGQRSGYNFRFGYRQKDVECWEELHAEKVGTNQCRLPVEPLNSRYKTRTRRENEIAGDSCDNWVTDKCQLHCPYDHWHPVVRTNTVMYGHTAGNPGKINIKTQLTDYCSSITQTPGCDFWKTQLSEPGELCSGNMDSGICKFFQEQISDSNIGCGWCKFWPNRLPGVNIDPAPGLHKKVKVEYWCYPNEPGSSTRDH